MPRAKSLSHYPTRYAEIIVACGVRGERQEIVLPRKQAASLRGHFYAFVGVLKEEGRRIAALAAYGPGEADTLELARQSELVMVTIEETGEAETRRLVWQNRENSWQAQALTKLTVTGGGSAPTSTGLDDVAARLMQVQQEKKSAGGM